MATDLNVHSSVQVKSDVLKSDRKNAGYTQAAFCAACRSVSLSTVRRAEQGFRVTESALRRMAGVLNKPFERYVAALQSGSPSDFVAWLAGEWTCVYVMAKNNAAPYVTTQEIIIRQNGDRIEGVAVDAVGTETSDTISFSGKVANNVALGSISVNALQASNGSGVFCQISKRHNSWLEGPSSWFDPDSDQVQAVNMVSVRRSCLNYESNIKEAGIIAERELSIYRVRKLMQAGYVLDDAIIMIAALKTGK